MIRFCSRFLHSRHFFFFVNLLFFVNVPSPPLPFSSLTLLLILFLHRIYFSLFRSPSGLLIFFEIRCKTRDLTLLDPGFLIRYIGSLFFQHHCSPIFLNHPLIHF